MTANMISNNAPNAPNAPNDSSPTKNPNLSSSTSTHTNTPQQYGLDPSSTSHEQARLDLQHRMYSLMLDRRLSAADLPQPIRCGRVLDIGTGTGIWACDFARQYPESHVWATDLRIPDIKDTPENVTWVVADVEKEWDFSDVEPPIPGNGPVFDYIHARLLTFAVHDWDAVLDKCWQWLAPGGVLEILDAGVKMVVEEGDEADRDALERFHARWHEAALRMGFDREDKGDFREKLREKGFEMLKGEELVLPVGLWEGQTEKESQIGELTLANVRRGFPMVVKTFIPRGDGMDEQKAQQLGEHVLAALDRCRLRQSWTINVARKPVSL